MPSNNVGADVSQTTSMEEMLYKIASQTKKNLRDDVAQITGMAEMPDKTS